MIETLLSYQPADLLLFSPRVYWALVTEQNSQWWPMAILSPLSGLAMLWLVLRNSHQGLRLSLALTGAIWWFVAGTFLWQQYRTINWAVDWAIAPFIGVGAMLMACSASKATIPAPRSLTWWTGLLLMAWGSLLHPLGFLLDDRPVSAADTWLLFPDPLTTTTLGVALVSLKGWRLAVIMPLPLLWSLAGGAMLLGLESPAGWGVLAGAGLAILAWVCPARPDPRHAGQTSSSMR